MSEQQTLQQRIHSHLNSLSGAAVLSPEISEHPALNEDLRQYAVIRLPIEAHRTVSYLVGPKSGYVSLSALNEFFSTLLPEGITPNQRESYAEMGGRWLRHGHLLIDEKTLGHKMGNNGVYVERTIITALPYAPDAKVARTLLIEKHLVHQTSLEKLESAKAVGFQ